MTLGDVVPVVDEPESVDDGVSVVDEPESVGDGVSVEDEVLLSVELSVELLVEVSVGSDELVVVSLVGAASLEDEEGSDEPATGSADAAAPVVAVVLGAGVSSA